MMGYPGWMIAKWQEERAKNATTWKQMKDRDLTGLTVIFKKSPLIQGKYYFYFKEITPQRKGATMTYLANLAKSHIQREWVNKGYGGYNTFLTLNEKEYERMKSEVERLGGVVTLILSEEK